MKKLLFYLLLFVVSSGYAQDIQKTSKPPAFKKGSGTIAFGIGSGGRLNYFTTTSASPLITASAETAFIDNVGIGTIGFGAIAGFKTASYNNIFDQTDNWYQIIFAPRATYHFAFHHAFDPYVGATIGASYTIYDGNSVSGLGNNLKPLRAVGGVFAGAKYNLTRWFGVFAEAGLDVSRFRVGINFNRNNR